MSAAFCYIVFALYVSCNPVHASSFCVEWHVQQHGVVTLPVDQGWVDGAVLSHQAELVLLKYSILLLCFAL
jgi:hypothetical protein